MRTALILTLLVAGTPAAAQVPRTMVPTHARPQPGEVVLGDPGGPDREQWMLRDGGVDVRNITRPTLTPVLPVGPGSGAAVIVAPGGGFLGLAIEDEGWRVARWLANHGVAAFVLKYRVLPTPRDPAVWQDSLARAMRGERTGIAPPDDTPPEALADGLAALRHVRVQAGRYGIDPARVGFMGFSAGGFLTRSVVAKGGADAPAFAAPIYPNMKPMDVPANAPPMFVTIAADDSLLGQAGGFGLVDSYRAAGKSIEFHLLADGGHGFGLGKPGTASEGWIEAFYRWLGARGFLKPAR
ncbi:esterase [Sphingomonas spermidinifaciens]|uniref:Esterase n=1 Tax=Sphingomonas spermidinifaciens TaxID=1141889 RepID=A0A2A4B299_9SPHN|nr:alpha/beta hydrolase [Sphingomonas spermidinifaciens]PCD01909.1 esterase [Sphingomonas spermidinifaciens]